MFANPCTVTGDQQEDPYEDKRFFIFLYKHKKNNVSVIMGEGLGGASTCMLVATAGAILSYIPIGNLASRIGRRQTIVGGIILLASMFFLDFIMTLIFKSIRSCL